MLSKTEDENEQLDIGKNRLFGIELHDYMFTITTTIMILRGDGKSNLENQDFLAQNPSKIQLKGCTVGMMNPPYSQGSKQNPELYEINQNNMSMCADGNIPLISAKKVDNGLKRFISDNGKKVFDGHILTLNNDGDGGVGIAYYQASNVAIDTHVTALIPKLPISREALLFISKTITTQRDKFSHGYSLNNNRIRAQKIVFPVNEDGNPNWTYMENFIKNIEKKQIKNVLKYLDEYIYIYNV